MATDILEHLWFGDDPDAEAEAAALGKAACVGARALRIQAFAVDLLGDEYAREIAAFTAVIGIVDRGGRASTEILTRALERAAVAARLAIHCGLPKEDLFVCALGQDIGKLALLNMFGESYRALSNRLSGEDLAVAERERYGYDHCVLARRILELWKIPEPATTVAGWRYQIGRAHGTGGAALQMIYVLRLADLVLDNLGRASDEEIAAIVENDASATILDVTAEDLRSMLGELSELRGHASRVFTKERTRPTTLSPGQHPSKRPMISMRPASSMRPALEISPLPKTALPEVTLSEVTSEATPPGAALPETSVHPPRLHSLRASMAARPKRLTVRLRTALLLGLAIALFACWALGRVTARSRTSHPATTPAAHARK